MTRSLPFRTKLATAAGMATAELSRRLGKGEGSVIGGRVSLVVDPRSLERLSLGRMTALVSATNGKTTTTSMLATALQTKAEVVTNAAGANMFGGMVGALAQSAADIAVLEVDEGHLPKALKATQAAFVVLLNLSRDQLDRVSEVRMQAQRWRDALAVMHPIVVANADDPMVVWAASKATSVVWVAAGSGWQLDAVSCPQCAGRIAWTEVAQSTSGSQSTSGAQATWSCTSCDLCRPDAHAFLGTAANGAVTDVRLPVELLLPGEVNRRNAAMALTTAVLMGADPVAAAAAVAQMEGPGGRFTSTTINGVAVRLILAKNPAGWAEALQITKAQSRSLVVSINARIQDGRDPSWLWDVPYEQLQGRFVVATGDRGRDVAVRLRYAEVDHIFIPDLVAAVQEAARHAGGEEVDVFGNYSAFQDLRKLAQ